MTYDGVPSVALAERIYAMADHGWSRWVIADRLEVTVGVVERTLRRRPKGAGEGPNRGTMGAENQAGPGAALTANPAPRPDLVRRSERGR